ncbi:MAG: hypothetical protein JWQ35_563, partial [Bacteriovoracaceae bacterium]|nr:hypothetical protein [Bacteriovoracaceae bacterium]
IKSSRALLDMAIVLPLAFSLMNTTPHYNWSGLALYSAAFFKGLGLVTRHHKISNYLSAASLAGGGLLWSREMMQLFPFRTDGPFFLSLLIMGVGLDKFFTRPITNTMDGDLSEVYVNSPSEIVPLHLIQRMPLSRKSRKQLARELVTTHPELADQLLHSRKAILLADQFLLPRKDQDRSDLNNWALIQRFRLDLK